MIDSYRKLTIAKYDEIRKILNKDIDEIDKQVELIACLADMDVDKVYDLPLTKYEQMVRDIEFLYDLPKPKSNIPSKLVIGDFKYKVFKNVEKMTTGQYIDLQNYMKNDMGVAYILTTIIIPDGCTYDDGDYNIDDLQKDIYNNLNIEDALSIAFFLHRKLQYTIKGIATYLDWTLKKTERKMNPELKTKMKEARKRLKDLATSGTGSIW